MAVVAGSRPLVWMSCMQHSFKLCTRKYNFKAVSVVWFNEVALCCYKDFERGLKIVEEPHSESENIIPSPVKLGGPLGGDRQQGKRTLCDKQSWQLVATFIDRLGFILYLVVVAVMSLHYLLL